MVRARGAADLVRGFPGGLGELLLVLRIEVRAGHLGCLINNLVCKKTCFVGVELS